jgi:hypothetical protein
LGLIPGGVDAAGGLLPAPGASFEAEPDPSTGVPVPSPFVAGLEPVGVSTVFEAVEPALVSDSFDDSEPQPESARSRREGVS